MDGPSPTSNFGGTVPPVPQVSASALYMNVSNDSLSRLNHYWQLTGLQGFRLRPNGRFYVRKIGSERPKLSVNAISNE